MACPVCEMRQQFRDGTPLVHPDLAFVLPMLDGMTNALMGCARGFFRQLCQEHADLVYRGIHGAAEAGVYGEEVKGIEDFMVKLVGFEPGEVVVRVIDLRKQGEQAELN